MTGKRVTNKLNAMFEALYAAYGDQHWWPGETPFEVIVGAVLTQNTAWTNVEKAMANLKRERLLTPARLNTVPLTKLALLIRPSGYFNIKARRLKNLIRFIFNTYGGNLSKMFADDPGAVRRKLLEVNGIGPETADCILLYAGEKPVFVVDAYTKRIFSRHGFIEPDADYDTVQRLFSGNLRSDARFYNEYHALIVRVGKEKCRKRSPLCIGCPLSRFLP